MSDVRFCGRDFSGEEIELLRRLCGDRTSLPTRSAIARALCEAIDWRDQLGRLKEMSARVALLRMERAGLIVLPPPRNSNQNGRTPRFLAEEGQLRLELGPPARSLFELGAVEVAPVSGRGESATWNKLIASQHYLGYVPLCGAQLRYLVTGAPGVIACVSFGPSAWKCQPRDAHIGWDAATRERRLHLVVGNARFLILSHARVPHLASKVLGLVSRRLVADWQAAYGYAPVLAETFVETGRFAGTSYKAANWVHVGQTKGRGKLDREHRRALPVKDVYLYPLHRDYHRILSAPA